MSEVVILPTGCSMSDMNITEISKKVGFLTYQHTGHYVRPTDTSEVQVGDRWLYFPAGKEGERFATYNARHYIVKEILDLNEMSGGRCPWREFVMYDRVHGTWVTTSLHTPGWRPSQT